LRIVPGCAFSTFRKRGRRARLAAGLLGSLALFPLVAVQGVLTRRRMPSLPPAQPPRRGFIAGTGPLLRIFAIGDSSVSAIAVAGNSRLALRRAAGRGRAVQHTAAPSGCRAIFRALRAGTIRL